MAGEEFSVAAVAAGLDGDADAIDDQCEALGVDAGSSCARPGWRSGPTAPSRGATPSCMRCTANVLYERVAPRPPGAPAPPHRRAQGGGLRRPGRRDRRRARRALRGGARGRARGRPSRARRRHRDATPCRSRSGRPLHVSADGLLEASRPAPSAPAGAGGARQAGRTAHGDRGYAAPRGRGRCSSAPTRCRVRPHRGRYRARCCAASSRSSRSVASLGSRGAVGEEMLALCADGADPIASVQAHYGTA